MPILLRQPRQVKPTALDDKVTAAIALSEDLVLEAASRHLWSRVEALCIKHEDELVQIEEDRKKSTGGICASIASEYAVAPAVADAARPGQAEKKKFTLTKEEQARRDAALQARRQEAAKGKTHIHKAKLKGALRMGTLKHLAGQQAADEGKVEEEEEEESEEESDDDGDGGDDAKNAAAPLEAGRGQFTGMGRKSLSDRLAGPGSRVLPRDGRLALHHAAQASKLDKASSSVTNASCDDERKNVCDERAA